MQMRKCHTNIPVFYYFFSALDISVGFMLLQVILFTHVYCANVNICVNYSCATDLQILLFLAVDSIVW